MGSEDKIENYMDIKIYKNGRIDIKTPNSMSETYEKLSSMGYYYISPNKIGYRAETIYEQDRYLTKKEFIDEFLKYLETLDISKYEGLTFDFLRKKYKEERIIRSNGLMKNYLPK